jgi:DNA repair exonuclease SbcCD ATPase subunit
MCFFPVVASRQWEATMALSPHTINFPHDPDPLAKYRREHELQELESARERRQEEREQRREQQIVDTRTESWIAWIDARVEQKLNSALEAVGQALGELLDQQHEKIQAALDRRDAAIQALRNELDIKIGLGRKLARLKAEVDEARQQQPNFEAELASLRAEVAKQEKTIRRLRGQNSTLEYQQGQLGAQLAKMKREAAAPSAVVQLETSASCLTVGNLHPDAANALREFASQVVDAWDGGPVWLSDPPAGKA